MYTNTEYRELKSNPGPWLWTIRRLSRMALSIAVLTGLLMLAGCGNSSSSPSGSTQLAGNWQFTTTAPTDNSFTGGVLGGFLQQTGGTAQGQLVYSISSPTVSQSPCSGGSAAVKGNVSGQTVNLTALAGLQTFKFSGTLSPDGTTMAGTYSSSDGQGCGTAQTGLQWTAMRIPPISGQINGSFHSTGLGKQTGLIDQAFPVTGLLQQGPNTGATSATISGTLNFLTYPCLSSASVTGEISGNSVVLQIIATNGLNAGTIGAVPGASGPVMVSGASGGGQLLEGNNGYSVSTKGCPGGSIPGDEGNICLGVGTGNNACAQPITLTPASLTFPVQMLGTPAMTQSITLTNTDPSGVALNGLTLTFQDVPPSSNFPVSDFDGLPSFTEQDNCSTSPGSSFSLGPGQSCTVNISFAPQQSCPWIPGTVSPSQCPPFLGATVPVPPSQIANVSVLSPTSADANKIFVVPIIGVGLSVLQPSTPELDFGAESLGESSPSQSLSFSNQGASPVQILPSTAGACATPLPRPLVPGAAPGLQLVIGNSISSFNSTITYLCDIDPISSQPNFKIASDSCSGAVLESLQTCDISIVYTPQPGTPLSPALDYFLELNTLECGNGTATNCEIDSGRFPVEVKGNLPSPLRMTPGAGLDFGIQVKGQTSPAMNITLFNDPNDPNAGAINFTGNVVKGPFAERDNCGVSLAPGGSCNVALTFTPQSIGYSRGTVTITYNSGQTQTISMRGTGQ